MKKRTDGTEQIIDEGGIKYAVYTEGTEKIKLEMPEKPQMSKNLVHWIRNEMTLPEFEIAAAFKPEMFRNKSFISAVRFPMIFKEFRTNQNWSAEIRDLMTYIKNAPLDLVRDLPNDSEEKLGKAIEEAIKIWIFKEKQREIIQRQMKMMKNGIWDKDNFKFNREELYEGR